MKKLVFLLVCVFTVSTVAMADNEKPIQVGQLPTKAQTFITTYFKGYSCKYIQHNYHIFFFGTISKQLNALRTIESL